MMAYAVASAAMPSARPNGGRVGGPSGWPVMCGEAAHGLGEGAEAGAVRVRAELPEAGDAGEHEAAGCSRDSSSQPRSHRSSVPGRKFSMTTSASRDEPPEDLPALRGCRG